MKTNVHFTHDYFSSATNPITVSLIGVGGTGSRVLTCLAQIDESLNALGHPGLSVSVWDEDIVSTANLGRQLFFESEVGLPKAGCLVNRINRAFGTNWKAICRRFQAENIPKNFEANIIITCVDTVKVRFEVDAYLKKAEAQNERRSMSRGQTLYWMDYGNSRYTGQVLLSTIGTHTQPKSEKFNTVSDLPFVTEEYGDLLTASETGDDTPSCSLAEALTKQDLFINSTLAQMGSSLLWSLFRERMTEYRGFFLNLSDLRTIPIPV